MALQPTFAQHSQHAPLVFAASAAAIWTGQNASDSIAVFMVLRLFRSPEERTQPEKAGAAGNRIDGGACVPGRVENYGSQHVRHHADAAGKVKPIFSPIATASAINSGVRSTNRAA